MIMDMVAPIAEFSETLQGHFMSVIVSLRLSQSEISVREARIRNRGVFDFAITLAEKKKISSIKNKST